MTTPIDIVVNYMFKGEPQTLTTTDIEIKADGFDPLDQSTFEKELIGYLVSFHYNENDRIELSVASLRHILCKKTDHHPCTTAEYAALFGLSQIIATVRGYCFPLAA
ncbi:hypothetical protein CSW98_01880 [Vibrio sp. HA2012]|uniref:hypothetical protein n=1 Tax=Vibrio sp. HA2012 TaxID=1971595 RepID=UPI000C2BB57D|nr:hypothetical protein [Vibrio sp. HA2012]PJC87896.1 hypothetical protein CSW98_01880 [Vibrio sp. HA2012]